MMQRFANWLLYLTLFLLPWQTHLVLRAGTLNGSSWEYGTIGLYAVDILIVISLILGVLAKGYVELVFNRIAYRYLLCGVLVYLALIIPFSLSPALSLLKTGYIAAAIILIFALCETAVPFRSSALAFVLGAASSALLGICQFINQNIFASKWLGLAAHDSATLGSSVIEAVAPDGVVERWLRAYGSLDHPNMLGGFLACALVIASHLWLTRQGKEKKSELILIIISTLVIAAGLILSFSRGAWIAAALGLAVIAAVYLFKKNQTAGSRKLPEFFAWAACMALVIGLISSQYYYLFTPRLSGDSRLEQLSSNERVDGVKGSFASIKKYPLIGSGIGTYTLALEKSSPLDRPAWYFQPVHNTFLLIIAEIGIIGALLLFATIACFLGHLYKMSRSSGSAAVLITAILAAALAIAALDHWLFSLHFGIILTGALLGLLANYAKPPVLPETAAPLTE